MLREDDVFMAFLFILVIAFGFFSPDLEDCVMVFTHPSILPPILNKSRYTQTNGRVACKEREETGEDCSKTIGF